MMPDDGQCECVTDPAPWLAFGIDLRLTTTAERGRTKPLLAPSETFQYRPNWGLPKMKDREQVGAPVLCFGRMPLQPGEQTRAVISPFAPVSLPLWDVVNVGNELKMYEGAHVCGHATVVWIARTLRPIPTDDHDVFAGWCGGGPAPATPPVR